MSDALDSAIGMAMKDANTEKRPIERQFDLLREELLELDHAVQELIGRIHPVIGPDPSEQKGPTPEMISEDASGFTKALEEQTDNVRRMRKMVTNITNRVEL